MNLGTMLKRARYKARINQVELASKCGCTQGYISKLENGDIDPAFSFVVRLSRVLNVSLLDLSKPFLKRK